jgi:hypothetical protein
MPRNSDDRTGRKRELYREDEPFVFVKLGKPRRGRGKACARVSIEFDDGSKKNVRICEDRVEEFSEE